MTKLMKDVVEVINTTLEGMPRLCFFFSAYGAWALVSSRPSSALAYPQKAANSTRADCESEKASLMCFSQDFGVGTPLRTWQLGDRRVVRRFLP